MLYFDFYNTSLHSPYPLFLQLFFCLNSFCFAFLIYSSDASNSIHLLGYISLIHTCCSSSTFLCSTLLSLQISLYCVRLLAPLVSFLYSFLFIRLFHSPILPWYSCAGLAPSVLCTTCMRETCALRRPGSCYIRDTEDSCLVQLITSLLASNPYRLQPSDTADPMPGTRTHPQSSRFVDSSMTSAALLAAITENGQMLPEKWWQRGDVGRPIVHQDSKTLSFRFPFGTNLKQVTETNRARSTITLAEIPPNPASIAAAFNLAPYHRDFVTNTLLSSEDEWLPQIEAGEEQVQIYFPSYHGIANLRAMLGSYQPNEDKRSFVCTTARASIIPLASHPSFGSRNILLRLATSTKTSYHPKLRL